MSYIVTLYMDEDGWYVADCPSLPGCMSQGQTREEALANISDAIKGWLHVAGIDGQADTVREIEIIEVEVAA